MATRGCSDVQETETMLMREHEDLREGGALTMISDPQIAIFMLGLFIFMVMLGFPICLHA